MSSHDRTPTSSRYSSRPPASRHSSAPPSSRLSTFPPRPSLIPGYAGSNGPYIVGIAALVLLSGGLLLFWKQCRSGEPPAQAQTAATTEPTSTDPAPVHAPPPPPPEPEPEDAGPDAADAAEAGPTRGQRQAGSGVCSGCGKGVSTAALESKVASQANLAHGCYNRTLRSETAAGTLRVSVRVGSDGSVCGASIVSDTVGSPQLAQCVLGKFRGTSYPKPEKGCVVVNVPIVFKTR